MTSQRSCSTLHGTPLPIHLLVQPQTVSTCIPLMTDSKMTAQRSDTRALRVVLVLESGMLLDIKPGGQALHFGPTCIMSRASISLVQFFLQRRCNSILFLFLFFFLYFGRKWIKRSKHVTLREIAPAWQVHGVVMGEHDAVLNDEVSFLVLEIWFSYFAKMPNHTVVGHALFALTKLFVCVEETCLTV